jgi:hypothetical protein
VFQLLDDAAQATQPPRAFHTSGGSLLAHRIGDHNKPVTHEGKHARHAVCRHPTDGHRLAQHPVNGGAPQPTVTSGSVQPTATRLTRPTAHCDARYGVHEVSSGLRFFLVDEPLPENSLILDDRHAPASVAVLSA